MPYDIVKEWVEQHPLVFLSEALLGEVNIAVHLSPLNHNIYIGHGISIWPLAVPTRKCSLSPLIKDKGKKLRT